MKGRDRGQEAREEGRGRGLAGQGSRVLPGDQWRWPRLHTNGGEGGAAAGEE